MYFYNALAFLKPKLLRNNLSGTTLEKALYGGTPLQPFIFLLFLPELLLKQTSYSITLDCRVFMV